MVESLEDKTDKLTEELYKFKIGDDGYQKAIEEAEKLKAKGNEYVKENNLNEAIKCFSEAIDMKVETPKNSIYLSNRALINLKLENYGFALSDASKAIEIDPNYIKAYYRRASAYLFLRKYDEALSDLSFLQKHFPNDQDISLKIKNTSAERRKKKFLESIQSDDRDERGLLFVKTNQKYTVEKSYDFLVYESNNPIKETSDFIRQEFTTKIDSNWVIQLMEAMKNQKYIHKKYLLQMIYDAKCYFESEKTLVDIPLEEDTVFNVCGDVHGQFYDLLNIFKIYGYPSEKNRFLFNGDFVDRGSFSVEVIVTLVAWKLLYPKHFFMSRGNHESKNMNKMYGFEGEVVNKYDSNIYEAYCQLFCALPLCHLLHKKIFIVHGGLFSKDNVSLDDIRKVDRIREPPDTGLMCEMLWSDPCKENGRHPSKRGIALGFGPDVIQNFCDFNDIELVIRSHEVKQEGYEIEKNGKLVTVFSAPNYCDQMGNKGGVIKFKGVSTKPEYTSFSHVEHPKVPPMKYANPWMMF